MASGRTAAIGVIILAAGRGSRFTLSGGAGHKLDAGLAGKSVLNHVIDAVNAAGLPGTVVRPVGGTAGMGASIALGVGAMADAAGWLILPGDLPLVSPLSLQRVAQALDERPVVVPWFHQRNGHPVGFRRDFQPALLALAADVGAAGIVHAARARGQVLDLSLDDPGIVCDVDTVADLRAASEQAGR